MPLPKFMPCWLVHLLQDRSCVAECVIMKRTVWSSSFKDKGCRYQPAIRKGRDNTPPLMRHFKKEESNLNLVMIRYPLTGALRGLGARTKNITVSYVQLLITIKVRYKKGCIYGMTFETNKIRKIYL